MARITPPEGYLNWNSYIEAQADLSPDQSIEARRLIKRDIKLGMIASLERSAGGDITSSRYRLYNQYVSPGTVSPELSHPWIIGGALPVSELILENGSYLVQENGEGLLL